MVICVFRCLAVHREAHKKDNLRKTTELAREIFRWHDIPNEIVEFEHIPLIFKHFSQEIIVYDVTPEGFFALKGHFKVHMGEAREVLGEDEEDEKDGKTSPMTIGIFKEHTFLITDLEKTTKSYVGLTVMQDLQGRVIFCVTPNHAQKAKAKSNALGKGSLHTSLCLNAGSIRKVTLASKLVVG